DFAFWIQLHEVDADDTRIRLVLHADLNMMMRMMIGGKIKKGLDQAVDGLAEALNRF
ncbi:MAG TPA: polyketide cyclase, partial [Porphyromonadaceae bacterium]|nr:polyketide cyclase [Porphyromonadaceae bacterium]